jgi:hypothetical protein
LGVQRSLRDHDRGKDDQCRQRRKQIPNFSHAANYITRAFLVARLPVPRAS